MNLIFFSSVLTIFLLTFVPTQSFWKIGFPFRKSFDKTADVTKGAQKHFAKYIGTKVLQGEGKYKILNIFTHQMTQHNDKTKILMDVLLQKESTSDSKTYPLDYLQCNGVNLAVKKNKDENIYEVKSYNCPSLKDAEGIPKILNKDIVAQAANQYADFVSEKGTAEDKYVVWRILNVKNVSSFKTVNEKTQVKFSMKVQLVKKKNLLDKQLKIFECSNVAIKYDGKPEKFKSKYVTIKDIGKCTKITAPRF